MEDAGRAGDDSLLISVCVPADAVHAHAQNRQESSPALPAVYFIISITYPAYVKRPNLQILCIQIYVRGFARGKYFPTILRMRVRPQAETAYAYEEENTSRGRSYII